jgi:hypothetical protein
LPQRFFLAPGAGAAGAEGVGFQVSDFVVEGDNPLGTDETRDLLRPCTGTQQGLGSLEAAAGETKARFSIVYRF